MGKVFTTKALDDVKTRKNYEIVYEKTDKKYYTDTML